MRERVRSLPSRFARGGSPSVLLQIIDGQTFYDDGITVKYGVQRSSSAVTLATSAFDPNGVGTTPGDFTADVGIGRAKLWDGAGWSAVLVLVLLDANGPIDQSLMEGEEVWSSQLVPIPVDGGGIISAWRLVFP